MKTLYASTALALVLGLGAAGMSAAPAQAADAIVVAQADGGQGGGGGDQGGGSAGDQGGAGAQGDEATGGGRSTGESGAVHPMDVTGAQTEGVLRCDTDGDGFVHAEEARACYDQHFGTISGGGSHLTLEQFSGDMTEAEDADAVYAEIDTDGDGQISREEWLAWRESGFAEAAGEEGRMSVEDYERWQRGGALGD